MKNDERIDKKTVKKLLDQINNHSFAICNTIANTRNLNKQIHEIAIHNGNIQDVLVSFHDLYLQ